MRVRAMQKGSLVAESHEPEAAPHSGGTNGKATFTRGLTI
jgi:hypothetical protein